jgi:seryl-tRNA synthetase
MQKKEDATELQGKSVALKKQIEEAEAIKNELESKRDKTMVVIGNLVHDSVPVDNDEVCHGHRSLRPHTKHCVPDLVLTVMGNA